MTKRHFIELADWLRKPGMIPATVEHAIQTAAPSLDAVTVGAIKAQIMRDIASDLAAFCIEQNIRFNRDTFLSYIAGECGPSGGRV